jgi:oxalate decarboxylase/phosphoglucose isomerase-like protein (cupin superfamily)
MRRASRKQRGLIPLLQLALQTGIFQTKTNIPGDFIYLPPWCMHGIENTGREVLVVLVATSPTNP